MASLRLGSPGLLVARHLCGLALVVRSAKMVKLSGVLSAEQWPLLDDQASDLQRHLLSGVGVCRCFSALTEQGQSRSLYHGLAQARA